MGGRRMSLPLRKKPVPAITVKAYASLHGLSLVLFLRCPTAAVPAVIILPPAVLSCLLEMPLYIHVLKISPRISQHYLLTLTILLGGWCYTNLKVGI